MMARRKAAISPQRNGREIAARPAHPPRCGRPGLLMQLFGGHHHVALRDHSAHSRPAPTTDGFGRKEEGGGSLVVGALGGDHTGS